MLIGEMQRLAAGFSAELDSLNEQDWHNALQSFGDANIYQTWSYGVEIAGPGKVRRLVLRKQGAIAAIAQVRIAKLPVLPAGVAYVRWGPLWRRDFVSSDFDNFRQAIRALRNEFVSKRGLTLRLYPLLFDDQASIFSTILAEEGFSVAARQSPGRTILLHLSPSLNQLRDGMKAHWKRELRVAERNGLEVMEGTGEELFSLFVDMYRQMVSRKRFVEPNDICQFKRIQAKLPEQLKMRIMLCRSGEQICAGVICSVVGKIAVYLFGATSNVGLKSRGSYLLQWRLIEQLKREGVTVYDLNGVNSVTNPGTYKFKSDLAGTNGHEVCDLGRFDSHGSLLSYACVHGGEGLQSGRRALLERARNARAAKLWPKFAR